MKTIFIKNGEYRKKPVVLLEFPFDHQLLKNFEKINETNIRQSDHIGCIDENKVKE